MRILEMPFLQEYDTNDSYVMGILRYMAQSDVHGLNELLNHPTLQNGITDEHVPQVGLLYLGRQNPAAAVALVALPWVDYLFTSSAHTDAINYENHVNHFKHLVSIARNSPRTFSELISKPWLKDGRALLNAPWVESGCGRGQVKILTRISSISYAHDEEAALVLGMPLFESIGQGEWSSLGIVGGLLSENLGRGFQRLLAQPAVADGITDDERSTVALLDLEIRAPDAAAALRALPWVIDGVSPSEEEGVLVLRNLALGSASTFDALLRKSWAQDGINSTEARVIEVLTAERAPLPYDSIADEAMALAITEMPFMDSVEGLDLAALCSLRELVKGADSTSVQRVFSHHRLRGGITNELTAAIANLVTLWDVGPDMADVLLDSEPELVERRMVTLPLSGEMELAVIKAEGGTSRTMDLLEHALRSQEEFMGVPFPRDYATLLIADVSPSGGRGGSDAVTIVDPVYQENLTIIAHELAHTYWYLDPNWIVEGGAEVLSFVSVSAYTGAPLPDPPDSCSLADNLADLIRLDQQGEHFEEIGSSGCDYILGRGVFLDLYGNLGDEAFREGFGNLYVTMWSDLAVSGDEKLDECTGIDKGLCYLREAFVADAPPEQASIADAIITRRYYGSS